MWKKLPLSWKELPLFFALAAAIAVFFPARAHHAPGPMKVVALLTTSGPQASLGLSELKALQLGVDEINAAGGLLTHKLELISADDQGDPKRAAALAAQHATPEGADMLIGGTTSDTSMAIAAVANKARVPFIALGAAVEIVSPVRNWVFKTPPTERLAAAKVIADMGRRGIKSIALLSETGRFGEVGRAEVRDLTNKHSLAYRKYNIALGADLVYQPEPKSVAAQVARLRQAQGVGAVFVFGSGEGPALVTRELRSAGVALPIYQSHGVASDDFLKLAGDAAEGLRVASPAMLVADKLPEGNPRKALLQEFARRYRARYGEAPSSFAGYAYDALMLAVDAARRSSMTDFESVRTALENTRAFSGITGTFNYFQSDHLGLDESSLTILEVSRGAWRIAE